MAIYVYIDESGKLDGGNEKIKYQNYTAIVFTDLKIRKKFDEEFRKLVKDVIRENPELAEKNGKEIKGSKLWSDRKKYENAQNILLEVFRKKGNITIFSKGVDLTNAEEDYWKTSEVCVGIWTKMKEWLINDWIVKYHKLTINSWYASNNRKIIFEIYVDKETIKKSLEPEIKSILEETKNEKITLIVNTGLDSKVYPGIQMADIVANGLQRSYKLTGKTNGFEKFFKKETNLKIGISTTWKIKSGEHVN